MITDILDTCVEGMANASMQSMNVSSNSVFVWRGLAGGSAEISGGGATHNHAGNTILPQYDSRFLRSPKTRNSGLHHPQTLTNRSRWLHIKAPDVRTLAILLSVLRSVAVRDAECSCHPLILQTVAPTTVVAASCFVGTVRVACERNEEDV